MRFQQIDVGLETVDLETGLLEHEGNEILDRAFVPRDGGDPHEVLGQPNAGIGIERLQGPYLCPLPDHAACLRGGTAGGRGLRARAGCSASWTDHRRSSRTWRSPGRPARAGRRARAAEASPGGWQEFAVRSKARAR